MELSLDLSLVNVPKTVGECLKEVSKVKDCSKKLSKLDSYVKRLEDEMRKIDAFKRELPLCVLLLNDAILRLKEEVMQCNKLNDQAVIEEFMPLKRNLDEDGRVNMGRNDGSDKKNWMSSVQLWSTNNTNFDCEKPDSKSEPKQKSDEDDDRSTCENPIQLCNYKIRGGAFVPFMALPGVEGTERKEEKEVVSQATGLSLMTPVSEFGTCNLMSKSNGNNQMKAHNKPQQQQQQQVYRKQRRCWSPELHRRFIDALQQLGGSQVATPKQIRELMQVDGLTNDEVKSHLQKYRLHIRKLPASSAVPDQCKDLSKLDIFQSNSPRGPLHASGSAKGMSNTGGDSMEADDDDKSESHSWNGGNHKSGEIDVY